MVDLQKACGVADLKMSDYGITPNEFATFAKNAREVMGMLFTFDRINLTPEEVVPIYTESYQYRRYESYSNKCSPRKTGNSAKMLDSWVEGYKSVYPRCRSRAS